MTTLQTAQLRLEDLIVEAGTLADVLAQPETAQGLTVVQQAKILEQVHGIAEQLASLAEHVGCDLDPNPNPNRLLAEER